MRLSIIIPTKDRGSVFEETLSAAFSATEHLGAEIIVVNDSKSSVPVIPISSNRITLINNPKAGVASARNFGVKHSTGEILLFLDDDILIAKESVDQILMLHNKFPRACFNVNWQYPDSLIQQLNGQSFGRFLQSVNMISFEGWYNDPTWQQNDLFTSKSVASFHLSITKENFELTGGYDETFPHAGFEDHDFPVRLKKAGISFYIDSRVTVFHNEADKLLLENWLNNQERRAITRKVGVSIGYKELALEYNFAKRLLLKALLLIQPALLRFLKAFPNRTHFDFIYFKLISILVAVKIYNGYSSK